MLPSDSRLTSKDVRYIQKVRKIAFSDHFRVQRVPQYPNRAYHQISLYIAADKIHKASWRHYLKRRLIEIVKSWKPALFADRLKVKSWEYYKIFLSLNPKSVQIDLRGKSAEERTLWMDDMVKKFEKELPLLLDKMKK